ncbi:hypothetical protein SY83_18235 [Paenibacillus swuensis]|uniref:SGNH hydrolase-type esterase domain-containing protein n=1 Tax=Paenibacillus swuensis TaxID=1178515 RepID=A0A172TLR1_9BACL|nr:GDSL-type esterase/lipase family protein [Paenibacillus swuensis]ANE47906.1 hypothetical protein SY83_18235 [Paenibacillus swuensis]
MGKSRWMWGLVGIISLLSTLIFIFGFGYAVKDILNPTAVSVGDGPELNVLEEPLVTKEEIHIVALGDSLTRGTGDETGKGYVGHLLEKLAKASGKKVKLVGNLAVNGYRSDQLLYDLHNKKGEAYALKQANLVLLTIGGNDLSYAALEQSGGGNNLNEVSDIDPKKLEKQLKEPKENVKKIIEKIGKINPRAKIVYIGLYNPYYEADESKRSSLVIQQWNSGVFETLNQFPNMTLVPTQDLFEGQPTEYLAGDQFHPNGAGYERIADRVVQALE